MTSKLTYRQAFYKGVNGVFSQGSSSVRIDVRSGVIPLYKTETGMRCPIGHIIGDTQLLNELEGCPYLENSDTAKIFEKVTGLKYHPMIQGLQRIHDEWALEAVGNNTMFIYMFMSDTARLADNWGLTYEKE